MAAFDGGQAYGMIDHIRNRILHVAHIVAVSSRLP